MTSVCSSSSRPGPPRRRDYRNYYHLAFELRGGRIARVKEYVDTAYANERLMRA